MMTRKPFNETTIGKILTGSVVKSVLTKVPFGLGSLASDLLNKNESPEGTMTREKLIHNVIKIAIYAALLWGGIISFAEFSDLAG